MCFPWLYTLVSAENRITFIGRKIEYAHSWIWLHLQSSGTTGLFTLPAQQGFSPHITVLWWAFLRRTDAEQNAQKDYHVLVLNYHEQADPRTLESLFKAACFSAHNWCRIPPNKRKKVGQDGILLLCHEFLSIIVYMVCEDLFATDCVVIKSFIISATSVRDAVACFVSFRTHVLFAASLWYLHRTWQDLTIICFPSRNLMNFQRKRRMRWSAMHAWMI